MSRMQDIWVYVGIAREGSKLDAKKEVEVKVSLNVSPARQAARVPRSNGTVANRIEGVV
jgi:hypothetical protein